MTTNAQITKAIEARTGYKDIKVSTLGGCARFYCDDDTAQGIDLSMHDAIMVCYLKHQTPEQWADDFVAILDACKIEELPKMVELNLYEVKVDNHNPVFFWRPSMDDVYKYLRNERGEKGSLLIRRAEEWGTGHFHIEARQTDSSGVVYDVYRSCKIHAAAVSPQFIKEKYGLEV